MTLVMSMPHHSLGRVGRGFVVAALRRARSFRFGRTSRSAAFITL
jgi:hypothetical protein